MRIVLAGLILAGMQASAPTALARWLRVAWRQFIWWPVRRAATGMEAVRTGTADSPIGGGIILTVMALLTMTTKAILIQQPERR
jgi:hypothetical protein